MLSLMPQSTATTLNLWLVVRAYQRLRQLTRETWSRGSSVAARMARASSRGVPMSVDEGLPAAVVPDAAGQLPGVHALHGGDAVVLQDLREGLGVAEVAGDVVVLPDRQAADGGDLGLKVLVGDAVVADDGVGHHHQLVGVGGVGHDLLVAHHGGVEHDLAHPVPPGAEAAAPVLAAVGQHDLAVIVSDHLLAPLLAPRTGAAFSKKEKPGSHRREYQSVEPGNRGGRDSGTNTGTRLANTAQKPSLHGQLLLPPQLNFCEVC